MVFSYKCFNQNQEVVAGEIDAADKDAAILELQKNGFTIVFIEEKKMPVVVKLDSFSFFAPKIKTKDMVIFSRQISTLFEAGVSALKAFRLLADENDNLTLKQKLTEVADDIQSGVSLSNSLEKQKHTFTPFYVSMVRAGEESGQLNQSFLYLADYLDREYELSQKVKKALTYPIFVVCTFLTIMTLMFVFVIPKMAALFADQGTELPKITQIILGLSNFLVNYGIYMLPLIFGGAWWFYKYSRTVKGHYALDELKTKLPVFRNLFQKIFLTRLSDNMDTMLTSGVSIVRAIEITADVVDNDVYKELLIRVSEKVKTGTPFSKALYEEPNIPNILIQMVKVGEETGELGYILKNLAKFYKREVDTAIDSVVGLIEPAMIVGLGIGVGILVASVLLPMYTLSSSIS